MAPTPSSPRPRTLHKSPLTPKNIRLITFVAGLFIVTAIFVSMSNRHNPLNKSDVILLLITVEALLWYMIFIGADFDKFIAWCDLENKHNEFLRRSHESWVSKTQHNYKIEKVEQLPPLNNPEAQRFKITFTNWVYRNSMPQLYINGNKDVTKNVQYVDHRSVVCNLHGYIDSNTDYIYFVTGHNNYRNRNPYKTYTIDHHPTMNIVKNGQVA